MREIGHFIGGKAVKGALGALATSLIPIQARSGQGRAGQTFGGRTRNCQRAGGPARLGGDQSAAPCPGHVQISRPGQKEFDTLAKLLSSEHGKTVPDARGDIQRGIEVVEFACGIPIC